MVSGAAVVVEVLLLVMLSMVQDGQDECGVRREERDDEQSYQRYITHTRSCSHIIIIISCRSSTHRRLALPAARCDMLRRW